MGLSQAESSVTEWVIDYLSEEYLCFWMLWPEEQRVSECYDQKNSTYVMAIEA
jgi:hypothetical protein